MPILRRYLSARFASAFAFSLLILSLVVLLVDMLLHVDEVFGAGADLREAASLLVLRTLSRYFPYLLPIATFTGAFLAVGLAARSLELLALKAAGISPLRALLPIFAGAAGIAAASFVLSETASVRASAALLEREGQAGDDFYRRSDQVWYHAGRFIYQIRSPDAEAEHLEHVRVFERDERGRLVRIIEAERAERVGQGRWRFVDGTLRGFDPSRPTAAPSFERFVENEITLAGDRPLHRLQGDLGAVSLWTLSHYQPTPREEPRIRATLHRRLSAPTLVLLFALIAVPLGMRAEQTRSLAVPAAQGVGILFAFLTFREYGTTFALRGVLPGALAAWLVVALFTGFGLWQLARAPR